MRQFHTALLSLTLLSTALCAEEAKPLPEGVNELPRDLSLRLKELLKSAEGYRGLKCMHAVPSGALNEDGLRKKMLLAFSEELPPAKMHALEATLKAFGYIPQSMDLKTYYPQLLTSQVGGFYDPRRQYLILVQREGGVCGLETQKKFGAEFAKRMEDTIMVHEFTHAIQDQNFDLKKYVIEDPLADTAAARLAVVEGDATLTMYDFFTGMRMEDLPMVGTMIKTMMKDPKQLIAMSPDMPGAKELADAPAWFRENLLFSYMYGFVFCLDVKKAGGQKLLDYAFTKDPPRSSEQILHPEKWLGAQRDDPIELSLTDFAAPAPGFKKVSEGTLGELGIRILLAESLKSNEKGAEYAQDWGGDRFAVYENADGASALCWVTEWDTPEAALRFSVAAKSLGAGWNIRKSGATRVTLFKRRGNVPDDIEARIHGALAAVPAQKPANKGIDYAALGIKTKAAGAGNGLADAIGANGAVDVDKMVDSPVFNNLLEEVGKKEGGAALGGLLNNDATKGLLKGMMKEMLAKKAPEGVIAADGRSYSNPALGVTVKLPVSAKGWRISKAPMPMALFMIQPIDSRIGVNVVQQSLPMVMPIESLGPFVEMGVGMMIKNYKRLKSGVIGTAPAQGWELQYTGAPPGGDFNGNAHAIQRVYLRNSGMLVISAIGEEGEWAASEKALMAVLNAIELSEPAAAAPEKTNAAPAQRDEPGEIKNQLNRLIQNDDEKAPLKRDAEELKADLQKLRLELNQEIKRAD